MKEIGDTFLTNSYEESILVMVKGYDLGGLHWGEPTLVLTQGNQTITLSPETVKTIASWYYEFAEKGKHKCST